MSADIQAIHFETLVFGDLSQHESYKHYLELKKNVRQDRQHFFSQEETSFEEVFRLTGGRILLIERYVSEVIRTGLRITGDIRSCNILRASMSLCTPKRNHFAHPSCMVLAAARVALCQ